MSGSVAPTLVVYGNCQAAAVATMLKHVPAIADHFDVQHHFVDAPKEELSVWSEHIDRLGAIVVQNVYNWVAYPFRDRLPSSAIKIDIPFLYLGSLWPFDCTQNPDDQIAQRLRSKFPQWEFAYHDSLLARLRTEVPDPEARYRAYANLDYPDAIDIARYHALEAARLRRMDKKMAIDLGAFILDQFRDVRLFHTITHPTPALMRLFTKEIAAKLGLTKLPANFDLEDRFAYFQVPLHPKVIDHLGITWADPRTTYQFYDRKLGFEEYVRKYIEIYG